MAITLVDKPDDYSRVYDTNRCSYTFSSDQYTMPNYNFLIELYLFEPSVTGTTGTLIGTFKFYPLDNGTCVFNPTSVYKNYITSDINLSNSSLSDCPNSAKEFKIIVYDYYSTDSVTPPTKQGSSWVEDGRGLVFYNGCQQQVPYDYVALNSLQGNNLQWVMSGASSGKFLTDATQYNLDNEDEAFLWFLSDKNDLPTSIEFKICYWDATTGATIEPPPIDYDNYIGLGTTYNYQTSQSDSMPQTRSLSANYFLTGNTDGSVPGPFSTPCWNYRITRDAGFLDLSFSYRNCSGGTVTITITNGSWDFKAQQGSVEVWEGNYTLYDLGRVNTIPPPIIIVPPPTPRPHITCQYIYDTNIGYLYEDTKMWYFPISMRSLIDREMVSNVVSYAWLYYSINLKSGTTTINKHPFYVYKKCKEDKWSKWQLFWLNPHGGFDTFTFDRKMESNYKIDRTTYKQRTPVGSSTSFDSYFGGEKIFNTDSVEEITLRSNLLTQMESQLLIQLCQSPTVYLMKEYQYDLEDPTNIYTYGVPYIITTSEVKYEQKVNDKEIYYEIKLRSSNQKIIQSY